MVIRWYRILKEGILPVIQDSHISTVKSWIIGMDETYGNAVCRLLQKGLSEGFIPVMLEHDIAVDRMNKIDFEYRVNVSTEIKALTGNYWLYDNVRAYPITRKYDDNGQIVYNYGIGSVDFMGWGIWTIVNLEKAQGVKNKLFDVLPSWDYPGADTYFSLWCQSHHIPMECTGNFAVHLHEKRPTKSPETLEREVLEHVRRK